jgi:hypothetical protein
MGKALRQACVTERNLASSRAHKHETKHTQRSDMAKGYIPPTGFVKRVLDSAAPDHTLKLEHVYGYL